MPIEAVTHGQGSACTIVGVVVAESLDHPDSLVPETDRGGWRRKIAPETVRVGAADARQGHPNEHFAGAGWSHLRRAQCQRNAGPLEDDGARRGHGQRIAVRAASMVLTAAGAPSRQGTSTMISS